MQCNRYSHDLMAEAICSMFPGFVHGTDFMVAHEVDAVSGDQKGAPYILWWKSEQKQPDPLEISKHFRDNRDTLRSRLMRRYRDRALRATDHRVSVPEDAPESRRAVADKWKTYRQALRDVPTQPSFPITADWPTPPE